MERLANYASLSNALARLTDEELAALVAKALPLHAGVGGRSVLLTIDSTPIFVKRIPLTDLERRPEHVRSTANLFDIPLSCHYGLGGPGFSAWRELAATVIANGWVLSGACANFPLLYHWRVLPSDHREELEGDVDFWIESAAVRARLEAIHDASAHVVLFCEYIPQNLLEWLSEQVRASEEAAETAIAFVDAHLAPTIDFMNARGLTHFDTHFENITTDGQRFCFGDFGLALSSDFELTEDEVEFAGTPPAVRSRSRRRGICPLSQHGVLRQGSVEGESPRVPEDCAASGPARCRGGHSATGAAGARVSGVFAPAPRGKQADAVPRGALAESGCHCASSKGQKVMVNAVGGYAPRHRNRSPQGD